jgi:DMSO reductase anchor subunit
MSSTISACILCVVCVVAYLNVGQYLRVPASTNEFIASWLSNQGVHENIE